jgi:tRNA (guanine37-N1)-methyltransferase
MKFDVVTLFPELIMDSVNHGITSRALKDKKISLKTYNPRLFSNRKGGQIDDHPFGGGPGMLMQAEPVIQALKEAKKNSSNPYTIYMTPQGKPFNQSKAIEFSKKEHLVILCGRYEGVDQRIIDTEIDEESSVGDFVLSGGEIPSLVLIDAISRFLEGVVGDPKSVETDTFSNGLIKYPQYTRPELSEFGDVPKVLLSGDHKLIKRWQLKQSLLKTRKNRPDLLKNRDFSEEEEDIMEEIIREDES